LLSTRITNRDEVYCAGDAETPMNTGRFIADGTVKAGDVVTLHHYGEAISLELGELNAAFLNLLKQLLEGLLGAVEGRRRWHAQIVA
jgi:hypothetical protein